MDEAEELRKLKWMFGAIIMFLVSTYVSYQEFKFLFWGETAQATVLRTWESVEYRRRFRRSEKLGVEYSFKDRDGNIVQEKDEVSANFELPSGPIEIQYLPGVEHSSRIATDDIPFGVIFFFGSLAWMGYMVYWFHQEANAPIPKSRYRRVQ